MLEVQGTQPGSCRGTCFRMHPKQGSGLPQTPDSVRALLGGCKLLEFNMVALISLLR